MNETAGVVTEWFEWTFLPENISYSDIVQTVSTHQEGITPSPTHIYHFLAFGLVILLVRTLFERFVAVRIATAVGVVDTRKKPDDVRDLELVYRQNKSPSDDELVELSKKFDLRERYVRNWFRLRRNQDLPSVVDKFVETSWKLTYFLSVTPFMLKVFTFPWFYNTKLCWVGYPYQPLLQEMYYYYMLNGGHYISTLITVTVDVHRKDYWAMMVHHTVTVVLITMSYMANCCRIGTLVLALHDVTHVNLHLAKLLLYAKWKRASDRFFCCFAVVYLVSFLYINPCYVLYSSYVESTQVLPPWRGINIFNVFLFTLQGLHMYWTTTLLRMIVNMVKEGGGLKKDARSQDEEEEEKL